MPDPTHQPQPSRPLSALAAVLGLLAATAGCRPTTPPPAPPGPQLRAVAAPVHFTSLRKSRGTIHFLVHGGGTIAVHDLTADRLLVRSQVPPQTLVRIDPREGVFFGREQTVPGPLPERHVRELRLEHPSATR